MDVKIINPGKQDRYDRLCSIFKELADRNNAFMFETKTDPGGNNYGVYFAVSGTTSFSHDSKMLLMQALEIADGFTITPVDEDSVVIGAAVFWVLEKIG